MDSQFDISQFLDATTTEAFTKRQPLPIGDYTGIIGELKPLQGQQKKDPSKSYTALNVPIEIDLSPEIATVVGQPRIVLFDFVGLDITDGGMLDNAPGKNSRLKRYREALDMNTPGQPFAPRMMQGRPIRVKIKHEVYEGEVQDRIESVSKP